MSAEEKGAVSAHLEDCTGCRVLIDEQRAFLDTAGKALHKLDNERFEARLPDRDRPRLVRMAAWPAWRMAATAAAVVCVLAGLLVWQSETHVVGAAELLDRAVSAEGGAAAAGGRVYLKSASLTCAGGAAVLASSRPRSAECQRLDASLARANWDREQPLSARAFRNWRQSLWQKQDAVRSRAGVVTVTTKTGEGVLNEASLSVRETSLEAITITLRFTDSSELEIGAERESAPAVEAAATSPALLPEAIRPPASEAAAVRMPASNPLDVAEVDAWLALHRAKADGGYEAMVARTDAAVTVKGVLSDSQRRSEIAEALAPIPNLAVELHTYGEAPPEGYHLTPEREPGGLAEPLAKDWLKRTYPETIDSSSFRKRVLALSKAIFGRAWMLSLEEGAYRRLPAPLSARLEAMLAEQRAALREDLASLSAAMEPLIGRVDLAETVSFGRAAALDSALTWLIFGSNPEAGTLEEQTERLRAALNK